jgi:NAD(P)-dependent dehydrogenase (short-subunit alcohol dehydrogenase family)
MADGTGAVVVVGGTVGLGWGVARHYVQAGREVVLTGRDEARAKEVAVQLGGSASGAAFDLSEPQTIAPALAGVGTVDRLVLAALDRDQNRVREYDVAAAIRLVTLKLVGYTEVVHALADRLHDDSSILLFGGLAKDKPYPGSTTITTINHGVDGLVRTLSVELAPIRVNAIHPGIVGDSPYWSGKAEALEAVKQRALTRRWVAMDDITAAAVLLLENPSIAATELRVDGGWGLPL